MISILPLLALLASLSSAAPLNSTGSAAPACSRRVYWNHHHNGTSTAATTQSFRASSVTASSSVKVVATTSLLKSAVSSSARSSQSSSATTKFAVPASSAAVTTKAPVSSAASSSVKATSSTSAAASAVPSTGNADADLLIKLHNDFRAQYGASPVKWNTTMASFAAKNAGTCKWGHTGGPYGENIAAGVGGGYSITSGFDSWANEKSLYNWNSPGYTEGTGHFTQVVWKATTQIGCAAVKCKDGTIFTGYGQDSTYLMCEYYRAGNVVGNNNQYFKDNVGVYQG